MTARELVGMNDGWTKTVLLAGESDSVNAVKMSCDRIPGDSGVTDAFYEFELSVDLYINDHVTSFDTGVIG